MKRKNKKRQYSEVNYWESLADGIVALLLVLLLIMILLIFFLVKSDEHSYDSLDGGASAYDADGYDGDDAYDGDYETETFETEIETETEKESEESESYDTAAGGGEDHPYDDPDPGAGEGFGMDRSAVLVQIVDGETGKTIKQAGISFELYNHLRALQVLSTHYPKKVDYKKYETDNSGVFYLPEKVILGNYYFHNLQSINGYETSGDVEFILDESHEWDEPYVVMIPFYPQKNNIRIQLEDMADGKAVSDAVFQVIAAKDIVTKDGTTRYKAGTTVDTIAVDQSGYGESKELYLGDYILRQEKVPEYYGKIDEDISVIVAGKMKDQKAPLQNIGIQKTTVTVKLTDALYDTVGIKNAEFELCTKDGKVEQVLKTDKDGRFIVSDLKQNTSYYLKQRSSDDHYQLDRSEYDIVLGTDGLISGEHEQSLELRNRMIRATIGVSDQLFKGQVSDVNVSLFDDNGDILMTWNSSGLEKTVEGLEPGSYRVVLDGRSDLNYKITVEDMTEIQNFDFSRWTTLDIGTIIAFSIVVLLLIIIFIFVIIRRRRKQQ